MNKPFSILCASVAALLVSAASAASEGGYRIERAPIDPTDLVSLQAGARTFVNYCLNCHSAAYMRYNRLTDLGLSETQIKDNLLFASDKVGETMRVSLRPKDGKEWFGVAPPDLSVVARSRGADWLYTYLRTFYRDPKTATGWNNAVFPSVAMPHALWTLQGEKGLEVLASGEGEGHASTEYKWSTLSDGRQDTVQYDTTVRDLVNYLVYMGEPSATRRRLIGAAVLFALSILFVFAYAMKREYWKDVH